MPINNTKESTRYLTESEAAEISGMSKAWFSRARWAGTGPAFVKMGTGRKGAVRYDERTLRAWFEARTQSSTSEPERKE